MQTIKATDLHRKFRVAQWRDLCVDALSWECFSTERTRISCFALLVTTISTDNITVTNEYRSGAGAHWAFLSDVGRTVQKDLDIAEYAEVP